MIKALAICTLVLATVHLATRYSTTTRTLVEYKVNTQREFTGVLPEGVFDHLTVTDFYEVCRGMMPID